MRFVIVGAGNVGLGLAERLTNNRHDVVLIEKDESVVQQIHGSLDIQVLKGNACSAKKLQEAGIANADYLIAVSNNDEANIAVCLLAKLINPQVKRILRAHNVDLPQQPLDEFFDFVLNPDEAGAEHVFRLLKMVGAKDMVEFAGGKLLVLSLEVKENSKLAAKRLSALKGTFPETPFLILGVVRNGNLIIPNGKEHLKTGDLVYIITLPEKVAALFELCGQKKEPLKYVVIWGGSNLALSLADKLEKTTIQTKLIVPDDDLVYSDRYKHTLVLRGDGTDMRLLVQENISEANVFVTATDDEENNILGAILAKKLGARSTMALVKKGAYLSLLSTLGVDCVVNANVAAASSIFRYIHAGSVLSELALEKRNAGFVEIEVDTDSELCEKTLQDLALPVGILIAAIERGDEVIIPTGEVAIKAGDILVIFLLRSEMRKLEKRLQLRFELV